MVKVMKESFVVAVSFLTILPVRLTDEVDERQIGSSTAAFPLVGLVRSLVLAASVALLQHVLPLSIVAALVLLVHILLSAGLHIDGLADTFDALGARADLQKRMQIMKEPSSGPFGVASVMMVLLLKTLVLQEVLSMRLWYALLLFPVAGTMAMALACYVAPAATQQGLGSLFIRHTGAAQFVTAAVLTLIIVLVINISGILPMLMSLLISMGWICVFKKMFNGLTGDHLGAICETTELAFLILCLI